MNNQYRECEINALWCRHLRRSEAHNYDSLIGYVSGRAAVAVVRRRATVQRPENVQGGLVYAPTSCADKLSTKCNRHAIGCSVKIKLVNSPPRSSRWRRWTSTSEQPTGVARGEGEPRTHGSVKKFHNRFSCVTGTKIIHDEVLCLVIVNVNVHNYFMCLKNVEDVKFVAIRCVLSSSKI